MPVMPRQLLPIMADGAPSEWGVVDGSAYVPFGLTVDTEASVTSKYLIKDCATYMRVLNARVTMLGAGAASDTVVISRVRAGTTTAITDTIDLSVFSDKEVVDFSEIDDAACDLQPGDQLLVTTASDALVRVDVDMALKGY